MNAEPEPEPEETKKDTQDKQEKTDTGKENKVKEELDESERQESRIEELEEKLEEKQERIEELESRVKRVRADFENYKKRKKQEIEDIKQKASSELIEDILEVKDDLERMLENEVDRKGVEIVEDKLYDILRGEGVEEIEAQGKPDPNKHEIIASTENPKAEGGEIVDVYQKGYMIKEETLRQAKVIVASKDDESKEETQKNNT